MNEQEIQELLDNIREYGSPENIAIAERRADELRRLYGVIEAKQKVADARKPKKPQPFAGFCHPIGVR